MPRIFPFVFLMAALSTSAFLNGQPIMFLNNASHLPVPVKAVGNFDTRDWKCYVGAPVRSTPLVVKNIVVFGTTAGEVIAVRKEDGSLLWKHKASGAVNSSAAFLDGNVLIADQEILYSLRLADGRQNWKVHLGKSEYTWGYDYYSSSPAIYNGKIFIGTNDGHVCSVDPHSGKILWKFRTAGTVKASPAVNNDVVYVGDTEGYFYSLNAKTGEQKWRFETLGATLKNDQFGYDRKAVISSAAVTGDAVLFGCRDGILYCLDYSGKLRWKNDHVISWVVSSPQVRDSFVIAGSSDGRFVQAVNRYTGNEIWRSRTDGPVWSSACIVGNTMYMGSFGGIMYGLDLNTGLKVCSYITPGKIMSSAVSDGSRLFFGSDDGFLHALKSSMAVQLKPMHERYVFYQQGLNIHFKNSTDLRIRNYLNDAGYTSLDSIKLVSKIDSVKDNSVIVFASNYMPKKLLSGGEQSPLLQYLNRGGRIVVLGVNPMFFRLDSATRQVNGVNFTDMTSLGIPVPYNDLRFMRGIFAAFPTSAGRRLGLPAFWTSNYSLPREQVDECLGTDENGWCSAWIKKFSNGGQFIQVWVNQETDLQLHYVVNVAEEN